jgi:hypothetical protein
VSSTLDQESWPEETPEDRSGLGPLLRSFSKRKEFIDCQNEWKSSSGSLPAWGCLLLSASSATRLETVRANFNVSWLTGLSASDTMMEHHTRHKFMQLFIPPLGSIK